MQSIQFAPPNLGVGGETKKSRLIRLGITGLQDMVTDWIQIMSSLMNTIATKD